jgi:hypothetical protein
MRVCEGGGVHWQADVSAAHCCIYLGLERLQAAVLQRHRPARGAASRPRARDSAAAWQRRRPLTTLSRACVHLLVVGAVLVSGFEPAPRAAAPPRSARRSGSRELRAARSRRSRERRELFDEGAPASFVWFGILGRSTCLHPSFDGLLVHV